MYYNLKSKRKSTTSTRQQQDRYVLKEMLIKVWISAFYTDFESVKHFQSFRFCGTEFQKMGLVVRIELSKKILLNMLKV